MNYKFLFILSCVFLVSCTNQIELAKKNKFKLIPEKISTQTIKSPNIVYVLPKSTSLDESVYGLNFPENNWGDERKQEKIITNFDSKSNTLNIERRTDNGIAGSGKKYIVNVTKKIEKDNLIITLKSLSVSTYQQGLILPFPLPRFDIDKYLNNAYFDYKLEISSQYSVESINANFNRIIGCRTNSKCHIKLSNADVLFNTDIYPYRSGSKVVIYAEIMDMKAKNGLINVTDNIAEFKKRMTQIIYD